MPGPTTKRRLIDKMPNPYSETIDQAMTRLGTLEEAVRANTEMTLRSEAREMSSKRNLYRPSYVANTDKAGCHYQNRTGHDWLIKRISFSTNAPVNSPFLFIVGSLDIHGIRELMITSAATVSTPDGVTAFTVYSGAFDNDLYIRAGQDLWLIEAADSTGIAYTVYANLEVEEYTPYQELFTEAENYAMQAGPIHHGVDVDQMGVTADPDEADRHFVDDEQADDLAAGTVDADSSDERILLPDANSKLPPHLRI
jgi:hypothetical protein